MKSFSTCSVGTEGFDKQTLFHDELQIWLGKPQVRVWKETVIFREVFKPPGFTLKKAHYKNLVIYLQRLGTKNIFSSMISCAWNIHQGEVKSIIQKTSFEQDICLLKKGAVI